MLVVDDEFGRETIELISTCEASSHEHVVRMILKSGRTEQRGRIEREYGNDGNDRNDGT
jgi:hypothetical protein